MAPFQESQLVIDPRKIRDYLLATDHPEGAGKAAFFTSLGFDRARPWELAAALKLATLEGNLVEEVASPHGVKYVVDGRLLGRRIRTVWIVDPPSPAIRLVTAYPIRRRR